MASSNDTAPEFTKRSLTCAETAKLVRSELKRKFPGVKFSVRSKTYACGASIGVSYTDGPGEREVEEAVAHLRCADTDPYTGMKVSRDATLLANEDGSFEEVRYGADFIVASRAIDSVTENRLRHELEGLLGYPVRNQEIPVDVSEDGAAILVCGGYVQWADQVIYEMSVRRA